MTTLDDRLRDQIAKAREQLRVLGQFPETDPYPPGTYLLWTYSHIPGVSLKQEAGHWHHTGYAAGNYDTWQKFREHFLVHCTDVSVFTPSDTEGAAVLLVGGPAEGMQVIGPFGSFAEATEYGEEHHDGSDYWSVTLYEPEAER